MTEGIMFQKSAIFSPVFSMLWGRGSTSPPTTSRRATRGSRRRRIK
jgi:hypothetical protein